MRHEWWLLEQTWHTPLRGRVFEDMHRHLLLKTSTRMCPSGAVCAFEGEETMGMLHAFWCQAVGTIIVSKYMLGFGSEREAKWFMYCGERQVWRGKGSEEKADVGSLLAIQGLGATQSWAAAKGHGWVNGPAAAAVCVNVHGTCYHQRPWGCSESKLPHMATLVPKGHATTGAITIRYDLS